ncbi:Trypanosome variant surface glycoprotein (A-type), putative [Trypanosoma equiperdum]|uniref:Trypanosome variant surface glycoprotein (A-type), putative n=1 Tax=Trypanosoma equiperdum TaxID=5694 RepID=A0A1G4IAM6_TRYEQ|nr:Trypanosome variant surface glycoprotein (A-type), putative [Trypanosoma equiperdum]
MTEFVTDGTDNERDILHSSCQAALRRTTKPTDFEQQKLSELRKNADFEEVARKIYGMPTAIEIPDITAKLDEIFSDSDDEFNTNYWKQLEDYEITKNWSTRPRNQTECNQPRCNPRRYPLSASRHSYKHTGGAAAAARNTETEQKQQKNKEK